MLILEEVRGTRTGNPVDADPTHRHPVRLTSVEPSRDELLGIDIVEVGWGPDDALPFSLCLSVRLPAPGCELVRDVSLARGNVVLVDEGATVTEPLGPSAERRHRGVRLRRRRRRVDDAAAPAHPVLGARPLVFADPVDGAGPASAVAARDPHLGTPPSP
ncbi:hypothetical protein G7085_06910 [Tessaracoccus sp. HDW20]|uniref:hypothetical protein n=1 Tax=Tessaracoccus coleopterorum TaxID=2714950 RepID=UPI0018D34BD8|nr:hypothetical protein [Tessaracoccus coleopterorum]NHB84426.1 hypothetical protein [Tessaracoccus coleopterorum]